MACLDRRSRLLRLRRALPCIATSPGRRAEILGAVRARPERDGQAWLLRHNTCVEASRLIGAISWVVLVVALVYELPQLVALIGGALGAEVESRSAAGPANFRSGSRRSRPPWNDSAFKSNRWLG